ncbi:GMC family oxidoreductase [Chroococcidiopsis sp. CCALA 051]|uniref:GMC oxidoreductase n=1 Tax=Chroococcidiopsis sp. CCALA 051 TaxID=869949 RepID=UPI000D0CB8EA|nr:GMC oxidoreductase [Chroococcidiopsis sp. CCALA 051]MBE9015236.1 GMC family oxidoreductase [Chroococcidiopsidales cyanobacterium LEGE 13417]PSM48322.1 GMC family oxidoreductase [Chroococcidiopsis sp. CCALA 051]
MKNRFRSRRRFLQTTALISASAALSPLASIYRASAQDRNVPDEAVEALVLGSGFGGAITALRLTQAGIRTLMIERGIRWPIRDDGNTFATFQQIDGRAAWLSNTTWNGVPIDPFTGVLDFSQENGINILHGAGFGGGSLVYNAITYQPRREIFSGIFSPDVVDYDELDAVYYPRVRSLLQPASIPDDILASPYYDRARLLIEQGNRAGFATYPYNLAVDWNVIRQEIEGTKTPSAILGNHWYGINSGAKNSLDRNYLFQAEQTGLLDVLTLHLVTDITEVPEYGYRVLCTQIDTSGAVVAQKSFTCRYLFLAAGSIGTSKLLVRSKATGLLPKLNDEVGKHWGGNGDAIVTRSNLSPSVSGKGGPACVVLEHLDNPLGATVLEDIPDANAADGTLQLLALGIPRQTGTFTYNASTDSVRLNWTPDNAQLDAVKLTAQILDEKNTTSTSQPTSEFINSISGHPLGGATLGKACDRYGRVAGYKRLYVMDGAMIPGYTAITNPSFTIAALAERNIEKIIAEDFV